MREPRHSAVRARALTLALALALPAAAASGAVVAVSAQTVAQPSGPQLSGNHLNATEGQEKDFHVADVAGLSGYTLAGVAVDWGDGSSTTTSTLSGTQLKSTHTYAEDGVYTVKVTAGAVPAEGGDTVPLSATSTAYIDDAEVNLHGEHRQVLPGGAFSGPVADGTDHNSLSDLSDFTAVVDWGDGTVDAPCSACVVPNGSDFTVQGRHQYTAAGVYDVRTMVRDGENDVRENPVKTRIVVPVVANVVAGSEGLPFSGTVGSVLVQHPSDLVDIPSIGGVTIDWGDGSESQSGDIGSDGSVTASHTYSEEGTYTLTLTADKLKQVEPEVAPLVKTWVTSSKVTIADAPLLGSAGAGPFTATAGASFSGLLAHVLDTAPSAPASDLSATVDWGDGSSNALTLVAATGGGYDVSGSHTYGAAGAKNGVVHFVDAGGSTANVPFTVTVAAGQVLGITSSGPTANPPVLNVPNTGADLPIGEAIMLVLSGAGLLAVGRRRR